MDKKHLEATLTERKNALEEARTHYNSQDELETGPYSEVEFNEEIRQLEMEVDSLEKQLKDLS